MIINTMVTDFSLLYIADERFLFKLYKIKLRVQFLPFMSVQHT